SVCISPWQLPVRANEVAGVTTWDALQIVLMLRFRFPEIAGRRNFRNDTSRPQAGRIDIGYCFFGRATLLVTRVEDRGTVARAAVVALAVRRRRSVDLEEKFEQIAIGRLVGVEDDLDRLSVGAMISVGRIRHVATGIADSGRKDAWAAPYQLLHSPEATPGKNCAFSVGSHH